MTAATRALLTDLESAETRAAMVHPYQLGLLHMEAVDWKKVNRAIIEKWSVTALNQIKAAAWAA